MNIRFRIGSADEGLREFEFDRERVTIGRAPTNDVVVEHERVGRRQAELCVDGHGQLLWRGEPCGMPSTLVREGEQLKEVYGDEPHNWELCAGDVVRLGGPGATIDILILSAPCERQSKPIVVPYSDAAPDGESIDVILNLARDVAGDPSPRPLLDAFARLSRELHLPSETVSFVMFSGGDDFHNDTFCMGKDGGARAAPDPFAAIPSKWLNDSREAGRSLVAMAGQVILPFGSPAVTSALVVGAPDPSPQMLRSFALVGAWLEPFAKLAISRRQLERHCDAVQEENRYFRARQRRHYLYKELVCESDAMRRVHRDLERFRDEDNPILIVGEAGTGKELLARALHHNGKRADQIIVRVSCAQYADETANFELFGSAPIQDTPPRKGVFELARGGTVFLEELDLLPPMVQAKLCRALKEGEVRRVGEAMGRPVHARLVASIHRDLDEAVTEGRLRRDLYLLLKDQTIEVPPLRERAEDILPLARRFAAVFCSRYGLEKTEFTREADESLLAYQWPGNVRELQARIESAVLDPSTPKITPGALGLGAESSRP